MGLGTHLVYRSRTTPRHQGLFLTVTRRTIRAMSYLIDVVGVVAGLVIAVLMFVMIDTCDISED
jgi:uncharacterized RDD family membrane protein YckC